VLLFNSIFLHMHWTMNNKLLKQRMYLKFCTHMENVCFSPYMVRNLATMRTPIWHYELVHNHGERVQHLAQNSRLFLYVWVTIRHTKPGYC